MSEQYKAVLRNVRIAPRKVRLVADLVRGKQVQEALDLLKLTTKRSAPVMAGLLTSAIANATSKATVDVDRLVISELMVDGGAVLKRFIPRAQGRATPVRKRTSHITMKLKEI